MNIGINRLIKQAQPVREQISYLRRGLTLVFTAAPGWTSAGLALLAVRGVVPAITVTITRLLVDSLTAAINIGLSGDTLLPVLRYGVLFGCAIAIAQILARVADWIQIIQGELVREHVAMLVHRQSVALDMAFYDSSGYYDHLYRARAEAGFRPVSLLENLGSVLQNGITLASLGAVLITYGIWVPLVLLIGAFPALYVMLRHNQLQHDWYVRTTTDQRRAWYYDWLLTARVAAAEIRLFSLGDHYLQAHQTLRRRLREERTRLARKQGLAQVVAGILALFVAGITMAWMVTQTMLGRASLGDLTLFYQAFSQGQEASRALLSNLGQVHTHGLFLQHFFGFLELKPQIQEPPLPRSLPTSIVEGIRFSGITFHYPGCERAALLDFDLTIPAGKVTAIVGNNGAGKTTLIKLLCRLYDPQSGRVEIDGVDIREVRTDRLRRQITVLFQEPVHYHDTVSNNIALSNLNGKPDSVHVQWAAREAGAHEFITRLPLGYANMLGNWFEGGIELSTGEWQRIALARAFLREAPIVILDEPTSAMDSWAEIAWLRRFRRYATGRTVILITHRLSTAGIADRIHVMDQGQIVESGEHLDLLSKNGPYAISWRLQFERFPST